jgi:NADPH:quinone reductase-like Zn-dependent oxidoreductase
MKAIVLHEVGGPEKLRFEELPDPPPSAGEVVVRLKAAALNHRDLWICLGKYAGIKLPIVLGSDGAGVVAEVGEGVDPSLVGRDVVINPSLHWGDDPDVPGPNWKILCLPENGTFAQLVNVPASSIYPKTSELSFEEVAALPVAALTAYRAVMSRGKLQRGETVLITGIGGGVALFALQIAKKVGARVLVTSGSDAKLARARELGADGGVNYKNPDWVNEVVQMCGGVGPDAVVDSAGGDALNDMFDVVRPGGRVIIYGATLGPAREVLVRRMFWKHLTIIGSTMGPPKAFEEMLAMYGSGGLRPVIDRVYPLNEATAALKRMQEAEQFGKIVLRID